ncbi:MAG TPA: hypothetical protein VJM11_00925 [Nevskiaceae bacterium]|nr:hypothetical protein [Nevskiaceae bacterium]
MKPDTEHAEQTRLDEQRNGTAAWRLWGPYLAERAWGTVREDYSPHGTAWEYFDHDQARSRAYRWNEDGLGGLCDEQQRLCFALALWNGRDPILKERAFGLTGNQGNRGEDVKELYFYLDATPSHSYLRYLYKYPQAAFPYAALVDENRRRSRQDPPFQLLDTGVFADDRYWDVEVTYAKHSADEIAVRIVATNRGPERATLHLLPTAWFRNTWAWGDDAIESPFLAAIDAPPGAGYAVRGHHVTLGTMHLYGRGEAQLLFTENESNAERLWGADSVSPFTKDAFHRRVVDGETAAVNPALRGSKFAAWHLIEAAPGASARVELVLSARPLAMPFAEIDAVFAQRQAESDAFYARRLANVSPADRAIARQAFAGMIWSKQFFHFDVARWLDGDRVTPPATRLAGRNRQWRHLRAADVISMPDAWEYPWFAAWDLAFHTMTFAHVDVDFAKEQLELLLRENYLHPNGQIPAYEWAFSDVNPPVHAMAVLKVFRHESEQRGRGDHRFLQRVFHKLMLNYAWWVNRKDADGQNVFEGGFLGLDNISVFDRSQPLPPGYSLKQADATGWMAMMSLNLTAMALELATEDREYEEVAIHTYHQFLNIANTIAGHVADGISLWDPEAGFFKDVLVRPDGQRERVDVYSWVGLIPLFACEVIDERLLTNVPRFRKMLADHAGGAFRGNIICACPHTVNERGEHLLSVVHAGTLGPILARLLDENEFLSPYGIRAISRRHLHQRELGNLSGVGNAFIEYVPGESTSGLFGGNSNWRGPVWMPTNYALVQAIHKLHRYLGAGFTVDVPLEGGRTLPLGDIASLIADRLIATFRRDANGRRPCMGDDARFATDPHFRDLLLFHEYFHGDTGQGLGAAHQTGWTGLVANLIVERQRPAPPVAATPKPPKVRRGLLQELVERLS